MDDVEIEDVNDDGSPYHVEKVPLTNQDVTSLALTVGEFLSQYGWYLLAVTVMTYLLIQRLSKRRSTQNGSSSLPQTPQDAAFVARRQEAMEAARRKMQEELDAKAAIFRDKQKQQEEEKRRQKIEVWESMQQGKSYKGAAKLSQGDLDPLATVKTLTLLSLLRNPVTNKKHYRLYVINKIPQIRVLDFQKVKLKERQEAEKMFKGKRGAQLAKDIARRTKTFTPGVAAQPEKQRTGPSQADVDAIKNAIANASSLAEVERLKGMLQAGQIPGRDLRQGMAAMVEEEEEEGETAPMETHVGGSSGEEMNEGDQVEDDEEMDEESHVNGS